MVATDVPETPQAPARRDLRARLDRLTPASVATGAVVAVCAAFVLAQLHPGLLLTDTTPAGGDMGAHVWGPAFLRDHLLPSGQLTGWSPDWYAGFPAYRFYMVPPSLLIVVLDVVLPYNVAFKLVSVAGLVAMPVAGWALGRLGGLRFPGPALLAAATVPFVFDRSFTIYGGNAASTLAGEFAFSHSLALSLVFLGVVLRGLETGRHRALAAVLLAATALTHVIPAIFAVVAGLIAIALRLDRPRLRWAIPAGIVGGLLTSWWTVPFVLRRAYLNDMGWERITIFWERLVPGPIGRSISSFFGGAADNGGGDAITGDLTVAFVLAVVGVGLSIALRRRLGIFLALVGLAAVVGFLVAPQGRLWNARLLPFWYLVVYLLAAIAIAELIRLVASIDRSEEEGPAPVTVLTGSVLAVGVMLVSVALPLRSLPGGTEDGSGNYHWPTERIGLSTAERSFIPDWARWNYTGYERKDAHPEYREIVDTMAEVGRTNGCGRTMWEYHRTLDRFGTPMALMLLPYWTDGCIGSMEGLYFEASATTPYHFLNQSELSDEPSRAQRNLPYAETDVDAGVAHLQLLGVRYYLAFSDEVTAQADTHPDLTLVATTSPWPVDVGDGVIEDVSWRVYEVAGTELVEPLDAQPVVRTDVPEGGEGWLEAAAEWYVAPEEEREVFFAADGPETWQRVTAGDEPSRVPLDDVEVLEAEEGIDTVSFRVSEIGTPVLVKVSYFPNWRVEGGEGPWRVAPNLMVVVPTSEEVVLSYGSTPIEWLGWTMAAAGVLGVVWLARSGPVPVPVDGSSRRRRRFGRDPAAGLAEGDGSVPAPTGDGTAPGGDGEPAGDGGDELAVFGGLSEPPEEGAADDRREGPPAPP